MHHRVRDAAHEVLAEADLRVHHAVAGEDRAVGEVGQVAGDRRRADVDGDAVGLLVEARARSPMTWRAVVDRDGDPVVALLERRLERADDLEVGLEAGQLPLALERLEQPGQVAGRRGELRRRDLDVVEADDRVDDEVRTSRPLRTTWRWTWLSGGTSMRTSPQTCGGARQAAVGGQALLVAVGRLERRRTADRWSGAEVMPCLGNSPRPWRHLAAAADARARRRPSRCRRRASARHRAPSCPRRTGRAGPTA